MRKYSDYQQTLFDSFESYKRSRLVGREDLFEDRPAGGVVVFTKEAAIENVLVPPTATQEQRLEIQSAIPVKERHRWFRSMKSSQALAQSVFGNILAYRLQAMLSNTKAEDDTLAFGTEFMHADMSLEESITTLGEPRPTSVDVWLNSSYRVAVECKLSEPDFGTCSRPRLDADNPDFCDGTYTCQAGRSVRCSLTNIGVRYWDYLQEILGWSPDEDHRPCPFAPTYQLVRNILAACVAKDGRLDLEGGHALVLYDSRNPAMQPGGTGDQQWRATAGSLQTDGVLKRLTWQSFVGQWPDEPVLDWLKDELAAKYGIVPT